MRKLLILLLLLFLIIPDYVLAENTDQFNDPEDWISYADQQTSASKIVSIYEQAYLQFPDDKSIKEGLRESSVNLLEWATKKHQQGNIPIALDRYNSLLEVPLLSANLKEEIINKKAYGEANKVIPALSTLLDQANKTTKASIKVDILDEASQLYPRNNEVEKQLHHSIDQLFQWAKGQHARGNYVTAQERYNRLLEIKIIKSDIKEEVNRLLQYAAEGKRTSDQINSLATSSAKASEMFDLFLEGYTLYEEDRFKEGLHISTRDLLGWATKKHQVGNVNTAKERYKRLLENPILKNKVKEEIQTKLEYANKDNKLPTIKDFQNRIEENNQATTSLELALEGYKLYPNSHAMKKAVENTQLDLLEWATKKHQRGNIQIALDRYNSLLEVPLLSPILEKEIINKKAYGEDDKVLPTLSTLLDQASKTTKASIKVDILDEASQLYPRNNEVKKQLHHSIDQLFQWAKGQHARGNYATAQERYNRLLEIKIIKSNVKEEVNRLLQYAAEGKRTSDQIYSLATSSAKASEMFDLFLEGYTLYEEDRFAEGLHISTRALLDWATKQHQVGNINTAKERYKRSLENPILKNKVKEEIQTKLEYANKDKKLPTIKDFQNRIEENNQATASFELALEGFILYPNSQSMQIAVQNTQLDLLEWATKKHQQGDINTAINRYQLIKNSPNLSKNLKVELEKKIEYAENEKKLPTVKEFIRHINDTSKATKRFELSFEAYVLYPRNSETENELYNSQLVLLDWATKKHQQGNYNLAKDRYNLILSSPTLKKTTKSEVNTKLKYANNGQAIPSVYKLLKQANETNKVSKQFDILKEGSEIHPRNNELIEELNKAAENLLNWASIQHQRGNFTTAISRYKKIIDSNVKFATISKARNYLSLAEDRKRLISVRDVVKPNVSKYSYNQMKKDIDLLDHTYPDIIQTKTIGKSVDGRNLYAVKLGTGKKEIFLNASHHAREHMTTNVLMEMIDEYAYAYENGANFGGYQVKKVLDEVSIWFVPMVNPDGVMLVQQGASSARNPDKVISINNGSRDFKHWKANIRGVDLNRQYPYLWRTVANDPGYPSYGFYKGVAPLSEPETQAVYNFTNQHNFLAAVAYHSSGQLIYTRYGFDSHSRNIANGVENITGYTPVDLQTSTSGAGYTDWFVYNKNLPGITPEISPYVGERPVPLSNWNNVWDENRKVGLYIANYVRLNQ
ncbi:M14 family metallopeptidase [Gracilibacillus sp. D59]|uniref:M14 family metallopeptidase n=1 Tax=Gracilibacillus sp. D59 TaxID=3457434 RepID=UPI003FCE2A18